MLNLLAKVTEAATGVVIDKKMFFKILQYSQETPVFESLIKLQTLNPETLLKRDSKAPSCMFDWLQNGHLLTLTC